MTEVDRLRVVYEVQDQQAQAAYKRLASSSKATSAQIVEFAARAERSFNNMQSGVGNIAAQFNDIGVTAAMGMNPMLIALQQGTQLSQAFAGQGLGQVVRGLGGAFASLVSPVSLVTLGLTAVAAVGVQAAMSLFSAGEEAASVEDKISDLESAVSDYRSAVDDANSSTADLSEKYGLAASKAQELLEIISTMSRIEAAGKLREGADAIAATFDGLIERVAQYNQLAGADVSADLATGLGLAQNRIAGLAAELAEGLTAEFGMTIDQAQELAALLQDQQTAASVNDQAEAISAIASWLSIAAEEANYQNDALNDVSKSAAEAARAALELSETTRDANSAAGDLSITIGGISFSDAISGADTLAARIGGMIGQARTLMSVIGQAQMKNLDAKDRLELAEAERDLVTTGKARVEIEGELAAIRKRQELDSAEIQIPAIRDQLIGDARATAEATQAATDDIEKYNKAMAEAERAASKGAAGQTSGGRKRGGGSKREDRPFFEGVERDLTQLERQIQLMGRSAEETARMRAQWELLDEAKKRGIQVNGTLSAQIDAQAAKVGALTAQLEQGQIAQQDFDNAIGTVADAITDVVFAGESLRESLANIFKGIAADILNAGIREALASAFTAPSAGGGFGGLLGGLLGGLKMGAPRATGGTVYPGRAHPVGENGTELFVPGVVGTVLNQDQLMRAVGRPGPGRSPSGGARNVSLTLDLRGTTGDRELDAKIARAGQAILAQVPSAMAEFDKRN